MSAHPTDEEVYALRVGVDKDEDCSCHDDNDTSHLITAVEAILTDRETALREEIAGEIEAEGPLWEYADGVARDAYIRIADRIRRGGTS